MLSITSQKTFNSDFKKLPNSSKTVQKTTKVDKKIPEVSDIDPGHVAPTSFISELGSNLNLILVKQ